MVTMSVVIPFYNEAESLDMVYREVMDALSAHREISWELVMVDDGSTDGTSAIMDRLAQTHENLRAVHLHPNSGQSAALEAGFRTARGEYIATLDGDGQNDPSDIFRLFDEMKRRGVDMMCGIRQRRADSFIRRLSSTIANTVRSSVLKDDITDVGCSVRVFRRACLDRVRFFRNAHRFFPALFIMAGFTVAETPVNHRARKHGTSKYGGGINSRLWVGLADLAGVFRLRKRALRYSVTDGHGPEDR